MLQKRLGQRIAELRKARKLTQIELAKRVGYSVEFISLIERGINGPSIAGLDRFATVLNVEVVDLFTFEPETRRRKPRLANRTTGEHRNLGSVADG
jgi:transcriptional regulator with XRE-family HTH domain